MESRRFGRAVRPASRARGTQTGEQGIEDRQAVRIIRFACGIGPRSRGDQFGRPRSHQGANQSVQQTELLFQPEFRRDGASLVAELIQHIFAGYAQHLRQAAFDFFSADRFRHPVGLPRRQEILKEGSRARGEEQGAHIGRIA